MADALIDVFWHEGVLAHDTGHGVFERPPSPFMAVHELHPENADRVRNMHALLERGPLNDYLRWHDGRLATADEVMRFHTPAFLDELHAADTLEGAAGLDGLLDDPVAFYPEDPGPAFAAIDNIQRVRADAST